MSFLETFYGILFAPVETFSGVSETTGFKSASFFGGLFIVIIISGFAALYGPGNSLLGWLPFKIAVSALSGVIFWLVCGCIFALAAYVFGMKGRPQTLLTLTAYATLPWVFIPVLILFKSSLGTFGGVIESFGVLGLWIWSMVLFLMALRFTYHLSLDRVLLAAALPFLMMFIGLAWVSGFFLNLFQLFS